MLRPPYFYGPHPYFYRYGFASCMFYQRAEKGVFHPLIVCIIAFLPDNINPFAAENLKFVTWLGFT